MSGRMESESLSSRRAATKRKYSRARVPNRAYSLDASPFPVWLLDFQGSAQGDGARAVAVDANRAAVGFHGASTKAQLLASIDAALGPDPSGFAIACAAAARDRGSPSSFETEVSTLSGARRPVIAHCVGEPGRSSARILVTLERVGELRRAEAVDRTRLALLDYSLRHGFDELIQATLDEAETLTDSLIGFFHIVADDERTLVLQNWSTRTKESFCAAVGKGSHYDIDSAGVWVECVRVGHPVVHNDYPSLPDRKGLPPGHAPVVRELVVPVSRGGKIEAILGVGNKAAPYDDEDVSALTRLADFAWEIAQRKRTEETLRYIASSFASLTGKDFFDAAASRLADELYVDRALIATLEPGGIELAIVGESSRGGTIGVDRIALAGSPFERLLAGEEPVFEDSLGALFPDDRLVSATGARSLATRSLRGGDSRTVIVAALDSRPIPRPGRLSPVIDLFRDRILAEVSRLEAESALESLNSRLEEEVRARSLELERAAKLAMLGRLVAGIAHELSTPLAAISSANESLGESIRQCIPGLPAFLLDAEPEERALFSRLVGTMTAKGRPASEADSRARKRRWRAAASAAGIAGADIAIEMLSEIGDGLDDEDVVSMLKVPRFEDTIGKAFVMSRALRASSIIGAAVDKASRAVRAMKTYAHSSPADSPEEVSLSESVESTIDLYFSEIPTRAEITLSLEASPTVLAQPDRLSQVWVNLIGNAIQAVSAKARIEVAVREEEGRALVSVIDEGPGIPEEAKRSIFTPFFTTKAPGEGLGLGLDICKRIVESFNGEIRFESAPGRTVFTVSLPVATEDAEK